MRLSNVENRVYSNDGRFYIGQSIYNIKDYKERELFDIADRNQDNVLDANEIRRYNSPILFEAKNSHNIASMALFTEETKDAISNGAILLNSHKPSDIQQDYYVGLKRDDLGDEAFLARFDTIDINQDKELDENEINTIVEIHKRLANIKDLAHTTKGISTTTCVFGALTGLAIGCMKESKGLGMLAGLLLGGATALIPRVIGNVKLEKLYNENLGEYKDHPYAQERLKNLK